MLLCDDNVINQKVASRLLQQMGYIADLAANGVEALAMLDRKPYDLVFMDVMMPEMGGYETTRMIRDRQSQNGAVSNLQSPNGHRGDDGQRDAGRPRKLPGGRDG